MHTGWPRVLWYGRLIGMSVGMVWGLALAVSAQTPAVKITLQLQWMIQSQFAGYYAAVEQGFYRDEGLEVMIKPGAVDLVPQQVVAAGAADMGIAWLPKLLASRAQGLPLVNIAQVFQRSGTLEVSWQEAGISSPADWRGKKIGTWGYGHELELFAAMRQAGINPQDPQQVTIVQQPPDMALLLTRQIDAAQAMIYNEYAQVLEAVNPDTGKLYQPAELHVINFNDVGTAMLQDGIFARQDWLAKPVNQETAIKFLRASFKGWIYCREHLESCVTIVLHHGPTLGKGHMTWMLNEVNALIWPSPLGLGIMDPAAFAQTVEIAQAYELLQKTPDLESYRSDLAHRALDGLKHQGLDIEGQGFRRRPVPITPGGE